MKKILHALVLILSISHLVSSQVVRERSSLKGAPKSVRIEVARISQKTGKPVERDRVPTVEYMFNIDGNLTDSTIYNFEGSIYAKYAAIYGDKGEKKEEAYYSSKGKLVDQMLYNYDTNGRLLGKVIEKGKTSPKLTIPFNYDANGKITEKIHPPTKDSPGYKVGYSYHEADRKIERIAYDAKGNLTGRTAKTFDAQGRLTAIEEQFSRPISGSWRMQLTYDGNGNVSEETLHILDGVSTSRYQYDLDEKGNWVKRTKLFLMNDKGSLRFEPIEIAYRTITYHSTTEVSQKPSSASLAAIVAEEEMSSYLPGEAIKRPEPAYPEQARRMGMRGAIVFAAMADEKGEVVFVRAFPLGHEPLRTAAEAAAWHWKFNPIVSGGYVVRRIVAYTFNFNL